MSSENLKSGHQFEMGIHKSRLRVYVCQKIESINEDRMKIPVLDGSNYFRGLLLLIRKDNKIDEFEAVMMERIGMKLGFEKEFCTRAIHDVLENVHIVDEPPLFSSKEIARKFIKDGLTIAFSDSILHPAEEKWLLETIEKNGLDEHWFFKQREIMSNKCDFPERLEVDDLKMI